MKVYTHVTLGLASLLLLSCNNGSLADSAKATNPNMVTAKNAGISYKVDTAASKVQWTGTKVVGDAKVGTIELNAGVLNLDSNKIVGGDFVLDMKSIQPQLSDAESSAKLKAHLSSSDFFATDSFPTAKFVITNVSNHIDTSKFVFKQATNLISGNLTIKGITKGIEIPAKLLFTDSTVLAIANFKIDRTKWGVNYGSENSIKDNIINKDVEFLLHIEARK